MGQPRGLKGEEVAPPVLLVTLAQDAVVWNRIGGPDAAIATARKRSGGAYDPRMAERFCQIAPTILAGLDKEPTWESVLALEPGGTRSPDRREFDRACEALADFADIKSPYTLGHSPGVAALAAGAGRRCGLIEADVTALRRAGLLHDIGRVGVSAGIWGKPGARSRSGSGSRSRLHAYYTDRVLARPLPLDGSGRWRRSTTSGWTARAIPGRSGRPDPLPAGPHPGRRRRLSRHDRAAASPSGALVPDQAAEELRRESRAGRLDGDAVDAVLAEAGPPSPASPPRATGRP